MAKKRLNYSKFLSLLSLVLFFAPLYPANFSSTIGIAESFEENTTLRSIPLADEKGIVVSTSSIHIDAFPYAYNPSIAPTKKGYLLSFRDDAHGHSFLGLQRLDTHFRPVGQPVIPCPQIDQEDPRIFWFQNRLFAASSHVLSRRPYTCHIALTEIDPHTLSMIRMIDMAYHPQQLEKNWIPIVKKHNGESLYFIYLHSPFQLLKVTCLANGTTRGVTSSTIDTSWWETKWGSIRGGTPTLDLGNEYLTLFHSFVFINDVRWYTMGAMTFEKKFPFRPKKISPYPILFHGLYDTPRAPKRPAAPVVAFPGGLVENQSGSLLYVVYGENDSGIKVATLNKKKLLQSLIPITCTKQ